MKFIKWKSLIVTCLVCLLPILFGLALWDRLPDVMAIHFDINNNPNNFASKPMVVFGLPVLMMFFQLFCCFADDMNTYRYGERKKFTRIMKWIMPVIAIVLQIATIGYSLGWDFEVRKVAMVIVGGIFLVLGNYMPKLGYVKNHDVPTEKARKINRLIGFEMVVLGILFLLSMFFPPVASVICLFLLIPCTIISVLYGIRVGRRD